MRQASCRRLQELEGIHITFVSILKNVLSISNKIVVQDIKRVEAKLTKKEEKE